jgi:hypothetical protein
MSIETVAVRTGSLLPTSFAGKIWSVHESAVNVEVAPEAGRPSLLFSIVNSPSAMTGLSVQLDTLPADLERGGRIAVRLRSAPAETSVVDTVAAGSDGHPEHVHLHVSCAGSQSYDGAVSRVAFRWLLEERGPVVDTFCAMLDECGNHEGLMALATDPPGDGALPRHVARARERLADWDRSIETLPEILASLVGLGPGMTPAGDDFVCGVLLTAQTVGANLDVTPLAARHSASTPPGATLLWLALHLSFPAYLVMPLTAVALGNSEPSDAARSIIGHGATSGTDALAGIVWALRALG